MATAARNPQSARFALGAARRSLLCRWALYYCAFCVVAGSAPDLALAADQFTLERGDTVVTGFSGIKPGSGIVAPGGDPLEQFFIDPAKPVMQVLRLTGRAQPDGTARAASPSVSAFA